jgi:hypothetical protein
MNPGKRCAPRDGHCFIILYGFFEWGDGLKEKVGFGEKMGTWVKLRKGWA